MKTIFLFLYISAVLVLSIGCKAKIPDYSEREKAGEVPEIQMDSPAENDELPPDVAGMLHDLRNEISILEKKLSGEIPELQDSLKPLVQNLNELKKDLNNAEPLLTGSKERLIKLKKAS